MSAGRPAGWSGRLASKIFSSSYLDVRASIVRAMILREPVHATRIRTRCANDPSLSLPPPPPYTHAHAHMYIYTFETQNELLFYQILLSFCFKKFRTRPRGSDVSFTYGTRSKSNFLSEFNIKFRRVRFLFFSPTFPFFSHSPYSKIKSPKQVSISSSRKDSFKLLEAFVNGNGAQASRDTLYKRYDRRLLTIDGNSSPWLLWHPSDIIIIRRAMPGLLTWMRRGLCSSPPLK